MSPICELYEKNDARRKVGGQTAGGREDAWGRLASEYHEKAPLVNPLAKNLRFFPRRAGEEVER